MFKKNKFKVSHDFDDEGKAVKKMGALDKRLKVEADNDSDKDKEPKESVPSVTFKSLFRFATRRDQIFIFLAVILSLASGCVLPLNTLLFSSLLEDMVKYGLNIITGDEFMNEVSKFALYNSILGVIIVLLSYSATVLMNYSAINQIFKIRKEYLKAALNQDFEHYDVNQTGDFASKMSDEVQKLEDGIGEKLTIFLYYQASFVSCVIMALIKGWKLALLCLISFPVTLTLVGLTGFVASRLSKKYAVISGNAGSLAEEVFSSIRTVYAFSGQNMEIERYDEFLKNMRIINIKKALYSGLAMGFLFLCIFCTYALSFWFGYQLMESEPETYSVNTMMAVFLGIIQGSASFGTSTTLMEVFGNAKGAGSHIFNLIEKKPKINPLLDRGEKPKSISGEIEFKNVTFSYPSRPDIQVLNGVTLNVKRGHSVALVGPSGCGKSTIIQLISRCYDVLGGSVKIDGNDVRELSVNWLRSHIGLVGQEPVLFNTTVRQNIRYGREDATDEEIEAAAKSANAHHFIMKLPKGYDTLVGERGASLSGGQKQRIAIARALVRNPEILLLDEATSALDTESEAKVQQALDKAQEGRTTIIVAHRLSTIRNVDQILVFKNGKIIESGTHKELMERKEQYYNMVMIQVVPGSESSEERSALVSATPSASLPFEESDKKLAKEVKENVVEESKISFWKIVSLNKPEWVPVTIASVCSIISGFAMPLVGIVIGDFIGALSNPNKDEVLESIRTIAIIFVIIGAITGVMNFAQVFNYGIAGEYLTQRIRRLLFQKLLSFEIGFFDNKDNSTGALCAKLSGEAASVQGATGQRIGTVLQAMGTFSFGLVLSLTYEWRISLVVLAFVPVIAIVLRKQSQMIYAESNESVKAIEASSKIAVDAVSNVRTVASLGREKTFLDEYGIALHPTVIVAKRSSHWKGIVFGLSRGLFNFIYAASMYYGGSLIVNQAISYEIIFKAIQALLMGATSATQAFAFAPNFQKGLKAARRILVLLSRPSKITDPDKPAIENFIGSGEASVQDVGFSYPTRQSVQVLKNFTLDIERGKTIALVGPSGCGKSTIIQLLERYYDPDTGVVTQDRIPLKDLLLTDIRRTVGIVSQEPVLFDRTIGENIAYGDNSRKIKMDEIIEAAKQANIHNFITSLPVGYETNIGSKGVQLSGGQKQRIAIARALVRKPKMLLLDEATSALDTESEKVVQEALDAAKAGRTCVIIAHRLSTVQDADQICVLNQGRLAEIGTHSELMALQGLYYNLTRRGH